MRSIFFGALCGTCLAALLGLTSGCADSHRKQSTYGAITAEVIWPAGASTAALALPNGPSRWLVPGGVSTIHASVTAADIATPPETDIAVAAGDSGTGEISKVPVGSDRTLTVQGLDASGTVLYEGVTKGISVSAGETADAGQVAMAAVNTNTGTTGGGTGTESSGSCPSTTTTLTAGASPVGHSVSADAYCLYQFTAAATTTYSVILTGSSGNPDLTVSDALFNSYDSYNIEGVVDGVAFVSLISVGTIDIAVYGSSAAAYTIQVVTGSSGLFVSNCGSIEFLVVNGSSISGSVAASSSCFYRFDATTALPYTVTATPSNGIFLDVFDPVSGSAFAGTSGTVPAIVSITSGGTGTADVFVSGSGFDTTFTVGVDSP